METRMKARKLTDCKQTSAGNRSPTVASFVKALRCVSLGRLLKSDDPFENLP